MAQENPDRAPEAAMFKSLTPLIPAGASLDEALAFYTAQMGFICTWRDGNMAGIEREGVAFNLVQNTERLWGENASFSVGVTGLDALYDQYRHLPLAVGPLEMKSWGRREFHMIVASGVCFQFYEQARAQLNGAGQIVAEVTEAFQGLVKASKALDARQYLEFIDMEKFTGLSADGKAWHSAKNLEGLINAGFPMVEKIVSLEFCNVKVTAINHSTAILVNEYKQTILLKSKEVVEQSGGGTQVWSKGDAGWKLVSISASDANQRGDAVF